MNDRRPTRVGIEIEFMGLSARAAARVLSEHFGTNVLEEDPHAFVVPGSDLGDLSIQLDIRYAHPDAHQGTLPIRLGAKTAAWLGSALAHVVPQELIIPPIAMDRLAEVDQAVAALRDAGATGRGANWFGSLGLHFNIDLPALDSRTIVAHFKAFLLLEPSLRRGTVRHGRIIRPAFLPRFFPRDYVRSVLAPDYWPDLPSFTDDYLRHNPTRNRALDLLPLLLHFDEERVRKALPFEKIGARPALHYRLPRAHVGRPGWSVIPDWDRWQSVPDLAGDPDRLQALSASYLRFEGTEDAWARATGLNHAAAF